MERYNVLGTEFPNSEGVLIMPSEKYAGLIAARPDFTHVNFGDFYTAVQKEKLGQVVGDSLSLFFKDVTTIRSADFERKAIRPNDKTLYNILGRNGVRLNIPILSGVDPNNSDKIQLYSHLATLASRGLFSPLMEGSIQKQFREIAREVGRAESMKMYWNLILS